MSLLLLFRGRAAAPVADPRLDQILAILMGRKVYDSTTGLWRVYDESGVEIADPSGILLRGLHGWLLQQATQQADVREIEIDFASQRKKTSKRVEAERLAQTLEQKARTVAKRDKVVAEKSAIHRDRKKAHYASTEYYELRVYEALLADEVARLDASILEQEAQAAAIRTVMDRLAWQFEQQQAINAQQAIELDMAFVMMMMTEAA